MTDRKLDDLQKEIGELEKSVREILVGKIVEREVQLGLVTDKEKPNLKIKLQDEAKYSLSALEHIYRILRPSSKQWDQNL